MTSHRDHDEDAALRSTPLRNAQSIRYERQRAEEELARAKEALVQRTQELAQSLAMMRATLESSPDGILATDEAGRVTGFNGRFAEMWGLSREILTSAEPRQLSEAISRLTADPARYIAGLDDIHASAPPETRHLVELIDGRVFERISRIQYVDGRNVGRVWTFRDTTASLRTKEALRRSERELADFFENAAVGVHWAGPDGTLLRANQAELDLLGYSRDEYVGHNIAEFHADPAAIAEIKGRLLAGATLHEFEARMRCKDGSIKHVLIDSSGLWENGLFVHSSSFTRDMTALRRSEQQLRFVLDHAPAYLARCGKDLRFRFMNRSNAARFGLLPDDVIGRSIQDVVGQEAYAALREHIDAVLSGRRVEFELEIPYDSLGRRFMHCVYEPERDRSGQVAGWVAVVSDITARKKAELRLLIKDSVTSAVAESATVQEAAPKILQAIGAHLGLEAGAFWYVDERENVARCLEAWQLRPAVTSKSEK